MACRGCRATGTLIPGVCNLEGLQNGAATLEDSLVVSYQTKCTLTIQSCKHTPLYFQRQTRHRKTSTQTFTSAVFTISKNWKQPTCTFLGEWINALWPIWSMKYDSVIKRKELCSHEKKKAQILNAH